MKWNQLAICIFTSLSLIPTYFFEKYWQSLPIIWITIPKAFGKRIRCDFQLSYSMVLICSNSNKLCFRKHKCPTILLGFAYCIACLDYDIGQRAYAVVVVVCSIGEFTVNKIVRTVYLGFIWLFIVLYIVCRVIGRVFPNVNNVKSWLITMHRIQYYLQQQQRKQQKKEMSLSAYFDWLGTTLTCPLSSMRLFVNFSLSNVTTFFIHWLPFCVPSGCRCTRPGKWGSAFPATTQLELEWEK